jgi:CheY-like chemotaxis protein
MRLSILVVEDDSTIRDEVRTLLESAGYDVHCVADPKEALGLLGGAPPPCILLWDALMGYDLAVVDHATRNGIPVATLPITIAAATRAATRAARGLVKTLVCKKAILSLVREHCPQPASISPV